MLLETAHSLRARVRREQAKDRSVNRPLACVPPVSTACCKRAGAYVTTTRPLAAGGTSALSGALLIECEQAREDVGGGEVGRPVVGGGDGRVEFAVGEVEPRGALVVKVG